MYLLGTITTLCPTLANVESTFRGRRVTMSLYYYLLGNAAAGKGNLELCKKLVMPLHQRLLAQSAQERADFQTNDDNKKGTPPQPRMLFIPANNTCTNVINNLAHNKNTGIIFDTEGDTMGNAFKQDYGDYSNLMRQAFHGEQITKARATENLHLEIEGTNLGIVLSSTPMQLLGILPSGENGLASRFIFQWRMSSRVVEELYPESIITLDEQFNTLGRDYCAFHDRLAAAGTIHFRLSHTQGKRLQRFLQSKMNEVEGAFKGDLFDANILRMGLIVHRICIVMSILDQMQYNNIPNEIECLDTHFVAALELARIIFAHSEHTMKQLPAAPTLGQGTPSTDRRMQLVEKLPAEFTRQQFVDLALQHGVKDRTADYWLKKFLQENTIEKAAYGSYKKS